MAKDEGGDLREPVESGALSRLRAALEADELPPGRALRGWLIGSFGCSEDATDQEIREAIGNTTGELQRELTEVRHILKGTPDESLSDAAKRAAMLVQVGVGFQVAVAQVLGMVHEGDGFAPYPADAPELLRALRAIVTDHREHVCAAPWSDDPEERLQRDLEEIAEAAARGAANLQEMARAHRQRSMPKGHPQAASDAEARKVGETRSGAPVVNYSGSPPAKVNGHEAGPPTFAWMKGEPDAPQIEAREPVGPEPCPAWLRVRVGSTVWYGRCGGTRRHAIFEPGSCYIARPAELYTRPDTRGQPYRPVPAVRLEVERVFVPEADGGEEAGA